MGYWCTSSDSSTDTTERTKLWEAEKVQTFNSNFNPDGINQLCGRIDLLTSQNNVNQRDINKIVGSLNDIYINMQFLASSG